MAYCDYTDIQVLMQMTFDASSRPTAAQVTSLCDQVSGEMEVYLSGVNIGLPITNTSILNMLKLYCSYGVASAILATYNVPDNVAEQFRFWRGEYLAFLQRIQDRPNLFGAISGDQIIICGNQVTDGTIAEADVKFGFDDSEFTL